MSISLSVTSCANRFELPKEDFICLKHLWNINERLASKVTHKSMYVTTVSKFLDFVERERYPASYEDTFKMANLVYFVSYLWCSPEYLEALAEEAPDTWVSIQLRAVTSAGFYACLVRITEKKVDVERMIENGNFILL